MSLSAEPANIILIFGSSEKFVGKDIANVCR
jgi:hypothetical protein